jgi:hypothetical protein
MPGDAGIPICDGSADPVASWADLCQARPRAARPGYRADMLCGTAAAMQVAFAGASVPLCRIHHLVFLRWGAIAEAEAASRWGWVHKSDLVIGTHVQTRAGALGTVAHITADEGAEILWVELADGSLNASLEASRGPSGALLNRWPFAGRDLVAIRDT